jgi:RHS repeat-associated protein
VAKLNGATTSVQDHITYTSFGTVVSESNPSQDCLFKYAGRPTDMKTGLENNRARIYDAALMRFISEDPTSLTAGDTNLDRYCGNDPVNATDPSGTVDVVATNDAKWVSGGTWTFTNLTVDNLTSWGEMFAPRAENTSEWNPINSPVLRYLDAGWWVSYRVSGIAKLQGVVQANGKKVNVDIQIAFSFNVEQKLENRATWAAWATRSTLLGWWNAVFWAHYIVDRGLDFLHLMAWLDKADAATGELNKVYKLIGGNWGSLSASPSVLFALGMSDVNVRGNVTGGPFAIGNGRLNYDICDRGENEKKVPGSFRLPDMSAPHWSIDSLF